MAKMFNPPHPAATLREDVLPALRISVAEAARQLGMPRVQLSRVLQAVDTGLLDAVSTLNLESAARRLTSSVKLGSRIHSSAFVITIGLLSGHRLNH